MQKLAQPEQSLNEIYEAAHGTHLVGRMYHMYYDDMVRYLGEPSVSQESGDGKTQVEWVFKFKDQVFTIYDWKTYDRDYTLQELTQWNIGGTSKHRLEFFEELENIIKKPVKIGMP